MKSNHKQDDLSEKIAEWNIAIGLIYIPMNLGMVILLKIQNPDLNFFQLILVFIMFAIFWPLFPVIGLDPFITENNLGHYTFNFQLSINGIIFTAFIYSPLLVGTLLYLFRTSIFKTIAEKLYISAYIYPLPTNEQDRSKENTSKKKQVVDDKPSLDKLGKPSILDKPSILFESDIEEFLFDHPEVIEPNLMIIGRQVNTEIVGIIDLLAKDVNGNIVVIELKRGKGTDTIVGQISRYMVWAEEKYKKNSERNYYSKRSRD